MADDRFKFVEQHYKLSHAAVMLEEAGLPRIARIVRGHLGMQEAATELRLVTDEDILNGDANERRR